MISIVKDGCYRLMYNVCHLTCIYNVLNTICTVRLQSSGATFRGHAVQVREASASFTDDAPFVGEFVAEAVNADWRIWDCDAVSGYFIKPCYFNSRRNCSYIRTNRIIITDVHQLSGLFMQLITFINLHHSQA